MYGEAGEVEREHGRVEEEWPRFLAECWERGEAPSEEAWRKHVRRMAFHSLGHAQRLFAYAADPQEPWSIEAGEQAADEMIALINRHLRLPPCPAIPPELWESGDDDEIWAAWNVREAELQAMPYVEYLRTPEWAEQRRGALRRAGQRCETCGTDGPLHVHHRTYGTRRREKADDLIVLCDDCHLAVHTSGGSHRPRGLI